MPPKPKFTKEEVVSAALELVSEKGLEALTARDLGARLGSSARPIFTVFRSMEELTCEVCAAAMRRYTDYVGRAVDYTPAFKRFGVQMILFATEEPWLFRLLFMRENAAAGDVSSVSDLLGPTRELSLAAIVRDYGLTPREAEGFFEQLWVFTYGLAVLCATGMCRPDEAEINAALGREFMGMMSLMKRGKWDDPTPTPIPNGSKSDEKETKNENATNG